MAPDSGYQYAAGVTLIGNLFESIKIFYHIDHFIFSSHEALRRDNHNYEDPDYHIILQDCQKYQEYHHCKI